MLVGDGDTIGVVEIGGGWRGTAVFVCILVGSLEQALRRAVA